MSLSNGGSLQITQSLTSPNGILNFLGTGALQLTSHNSHGNVVVGSTTINIGSTSGIPPEELVNMFRIILTDTGELKCVDQDFNTVATLSADQQVQGSYSATIAYDKKWRLREASSDNEIYSFPDARPTLKVLDSNLNNFLRVNEKLISPNGQWYITVNPFGQVVSNSGYYFSHVAPSSVNTILTLTSSGTLQFADEYGNNMTMNGIPAPQVHPAPGYLLTVTDAGLLRLTDNSNNAIWLQDITTTSANVSANVISFYNGLCLDFENVNGAYQVVMKECTTAHNPGWYFGTDGYLLNANLNECLSKGLTMADCGDTSWYYSTNQFMYNDQCLALNTTSNGIYHGLYLAQCNNQDVTQQWSIGHSLPAEVQFKKLYKINAAGQCFGSCVTGYDIRHGKFYSDQNQCADDTGNFGSYCFMAKTNWTMVGSWIMNSAGQCLDYYSHLMPCNIDNPDIMWSFSVTDVVQRTSIQPTKIVMNNTSSCVIYSGMVYVNNSTFKLGMANCSVAATGYTQCIMNGMVLPRTVNNVSYHFKEELGLVPCTNSSTAWIFGQFDHKLRWNNNPGACLNRGLQVEDCKINTDIWTNNMATNGTIAINGQYLLHLPKIVTGAFTGDNQSVWSPNVTIPPPTPPPPPPPIGPVANITFDRIIPAPANLTANVAIDTATGRIFVDDSKPFYTPSKVTLTPNGTLLDGIMYTGVYIEDRSCLSAQFNVVACNSSLAANFTFVATTIRVKDQCLDSSYWQPAQCNFGRTQDFTRQNGQPFLNYSGPNYRLRDDDNKCVCMRSFDNRAHNCDCTDKEAGKWYLDGGNRRIVWTTNPNYCLQTTAIGVSLAGCFWSQPWRFDANHGILDANGNCLDNNVGLGDFTYLFPCNNVAKNQFQFWTLDLVN